MSKRPLKASSGLTLYPLPSEKKSTAPDKAPDDTARLMDGDDSVPVYQRAIARPDGREDEDYYRDVENLTAYVHVVSVSIQMHGVANDLTRFVQIPLVS